MVIPTDCYPTTGDHLLVKEYPQGFHIKNLSSGRRGFANKDLADLLFLCDGTKKISEILAELKKQVSTPLETLQQKLEKALIYMNKLGYIHFEKSPRLCKIIVKKNPFKWVLNQIYLETTTRCNLQCPYCYAHSGEADTEDLDTAVMLELLERLDDLGVMTVVFTGGEPLLRKDIFDLLLQAEKLAISPALFTNGTLLNEEIIDRLAEINLQVVSIGLNDFSTRLSNPDDREACALAENIRLLVSKNIKTRINVVLTREAAACFDHVGPLLADLGVKNIVIDSPILMGRARNQTELSIPAAEISDFIKQVNEMIKAHSKDKPLDAPKIEFQNSLPETRANKRQTFSLCGVGTSCFCIRANGDVVLCPVLSGPEFVGGNILKENIADIWLHSSIFDSLRSCKVDQISECGGCEMKEKCIGGCKAKVFQAFERFDAPDPWSCLIHKNEDIFDR